MTDRSIPYKANRSGWCDVCREAINRGDLLIWSNGKVRHIDCDDTEGEDLIADMDEVRVASENQRGPLVLLRPACPVCHLELPKSGVCGYC